MTLRKMLSRQFVRKVSSATEVRLGSALLEVLEQRRLLNALSFESPVPYSLGNAPAATVSVDVNNDGKLDLVTAETSGVVLVKLGNGDGTFTLGQSFADNISGSPLLAVGDVNGDGHPDLLLTSVKGRSVSILLGNGDGTFQAPTSLALNNKALNLAVADVTGDGIQDLIVENYNGTISTFVGNNSGTFQGITPVITQINGAAGTNTIAVADFDRDGRLDLAIGNSQYGTVSILLNNGAGSFIPSIIFTVNDPVALIAADVNQDQRPDVIIAGGDGTVDVLVNQLTGGFSQIVSSGVLPSQPYSIAAGDFDGDGNVDLAVASQSSGAVQILHGFGTGSFNTGYAILQVSNSAGYTSVVSGDFNGDGRPDLAVPFSAYNPTSKTHYSSADVLINNTNGGLFLAPATTTVLPNSGQVSNSSTVAIATADLNGDGKADLIVTLPQQNVVDVLLSNGDGTFSAAASYSLPNYPSSVVIADMNGDGFPDIVVGDSRYSNISVLLNNGNGTFKPAVTTPDTFGVSPGKDALAIADFNGDGNMDVAVAGGTGGGVSILLGNGDGTLGSPIQAFRINGQCFPNVYGVAKGNLNGDGHPDLAVIDTAYPAAVDIALNNGDGTFGSYTSIAVNSPRTISIARLNNDLNRDIIIGNAYGAVETLLGNGDGTFSALQSFSVGNRVVDLGIGDLTGDGNPDVVTADPAPPSVGASTLRGYTRDPVRALIGNGDGTLGSPYVFTPDAYTSAVALADVNGDGRADIVSFDGHNYSINVQLNTTNAAPAITSVASETITTGTASSFTINTVGFPEPGISLTMGMLPSGITFTDNGNGTATLAGTPAPGTGGTYVIDLDAANLVSDSAQTFTITVDQPPAITAPDTATFDDRNASSSFTITTTGFPTSTITEMGGSLPTGVTFTDNGNGTATLAGSPPVGSEGNYFFVVTAANGVAPNAFETFTLSVIHPAVVAGTGSPVFVSGASGSFTVATTNIPSPTLTISSGSLPSGVTFVDNGNGTASIAGTPAPGSGGNYVISITASNTTTSAVTPFTLTVDQAPAITSAANATFGSGTATVSFTVTTTGFPTPTIMETGPLPTGVTFVDNGDGTATLSGAPAVGSEGDYPLSIVAANGTTPDATQTFTLSVVPNTVMMMSGGVVMATGSNANDVLLVSNSSGIINVNLDGQMSNFNMMDVQIIMVSLGGGNDDLMVDANVPASLIIGGGSGNDTIMAMNAMPNTIAGGSGNDSIMLSTMAPDMVRGGTGGDTLMGGGNGSTLLGNPGSDLIEPSGTGDMVRGGQGSDSIIGAVGDSMLSGGPGDDFFFTAGDSGNVINGGVGLNFAQNNPGDTMQNIFAVIDPSAPSTPSAPHPAAVTASPQAATAVTASVVAGTLTILGTSSGDTINVASDGTNLNITGSLVQSFALAGLTGVSISGAGGNDVISVDPSVTLQATLQGGAGNDSVTAGGGSTVLVGGAGDDTLTGGSATNLLVPGLLNTFSATSGGNDRLVGGSGSNIADFSYRTDKLFLSNDGAADSGDASLGEHVTIMPNVSALWGGTAADTIVGTTAGEFLSGGSGSDTIHGGGASDLIVGGLGKDTVAVAAEPVVLYLRDGKRDVATGINNAAEDILQIDTGKDVLS